MDCQTKDAIVYEHFSDLSRLSYRLGAKARSRYFFFTFTRSPFLRTLSAFKNKLKHQHFYIEKFGPRIRRLSDTGDIDFIGFARYLERGGLYKDMHWMPQASFVCPSYSRIDFFVKVENLHADLEIVLKRCFGSASVLDQIDLRKYHGGQRRTNADQSATEDYNDETIEIVRRLYATDFRLFDYSLDPF